MLRESYMPDTENVSEHSSPRAPVQAVLSLKLFGYLCNFWFKINTFYAIYVVSL